MEKEKNSSTGAKVLEQKKEKRRRLVLSSESETDEYPTSFREKADEATSGAGGGNRSGEEEKSEVREERETTADVIRPRFGNMEETRGDVIRPRFGNMEETMAQVISPRSGNVEGTREQVIRPRFSNLEKKEKFFERRLHMKSREAGDVQVIRKIMKSESMKSSGNQVEKVGGRSKDIGALKHRDRHHEREKGKFFDHRSDRKRSMQTDDAEVGRKKAKPDHFVSHADKIGYTSKKLDFFKHRDKSMNSVKDLTEGSRLQGIAAKHREVDNSSKSKKLHFNPNKSSKTEAENIRHIDQSRHRELQKQVDNRVHGVDLKRVENGGRSQHEYLRVQGKSGVLRVLHKNRVGISGNAIIQGETEGHMRRLTSSDRGNRKKSSDQVEGCDSNSGKLSKSSDQFERHGGSSGKLSKSGVQAEKHGAKSRKLIKSDDQVERHGANKAKLRFKLRKNIEKVSAEERSYRNGAKAEPDDPSENTGSKKALVMHRKASTASKEESVSFLKSSPPVEHDTKKSSANRKEVKWKVREEIKSILLNSGWKIDLRPRRGRDYEDAVYVSPHGNGYWSITKAYDVYSEQFKSNESLAKQSTFVAIAPELLMLLKRNVVNKRKKKKEAKAVKVKQKVGRRGKKAKETTKARSTEDNEISHDIEENRVRKRRSKSVLVDGSSSKKMQLIVRNNKKRGCPLVVRSSSQDEEPEKIDYVPYVWKRTILSWMIDMGVLPTYGKVRYMNKSKNKTLLEGRITRDGIHCSCCSKILTVSKFEIHAGSKLHQPYENTLVEMSGVSLLQCQINAWDKQEEHKRRGFYKLDIEGDDPNDDTCAICGDGGDLICCDSCPSTFHLNCVDLEVLPPGDWHCKSCCCKFCGMHYYSGSSCKSVSVLFTCSQCEQKYHEGCVADEDAVSTASHNSSNQFCGGSCRKVFRRLQKLIGVKNDLEAGYSWSLIRRFDDPSQPPSQLAKKVESNSKIAVAHAVIDECFLPITDHRNGINLIDNVVYNCKSNFNRLNYGGFYTFILERSDEIICAASVRIHGTRLAEMPFIGTRNMYRRQGMCRRLLEGIESALSSFGIKKLVIPAISELTDTWTTVFGFKPLNDSQKEEIKCVNMLVFPGVGLLHKSLLKEGATILFPAQAAAHGFEVIPHDAIEGSKSDIQVSAVADLEGSVVEFISTKELNCEKDGAEPTIPELVHPTSIPLADSSGSDALGCCYSDCAANAEPHIENIKIVSCSSPINEKESQVCFSTKLDGFIEEPKLELEAAKNSAFSFENSDSELIGKTSTSLASESMSEGNASNLLLSSIRIISTNELTTAELPSGMANDGAREKGDGVNEFAHDEDIVLLYGSEVNCSPKMNIPPKVGLASKNKSSDLLSRCYFLSHNLNGQGETAGDDAKCSSFGDCGGTSAGFVKSASDTSKPSSSPEMCNSMLSVICMDKDNLDDSKLSKLSNPDMYTGSQFVTDYVESRADGGEAAIVVSNEEKPINATDVLGADVNKEDDKQYQNDSKLCNPDLDTCSQFVTYSVESLAHGGEATIVVSNVVKPMNATDVLEADVNEEDDKTSYDVGRYLNVSSGKDGQASCGRYDQASSLVSRKGPEPVIFSGADNQRIIHENELFQVEAEPCVDGDPFTPEFMGKRDCMNMQHLSLTEHRLPDDMDLLEASHEINWLPYESEQKACDLIGGQSGLQISGNIDTSTHDGHESTSCTSMVMNCRGTNENAQSSAVSSIALDAIDGTHQAAVKDGILNFCGSLKGFIGNDTASEALPDKPIASTECGDEKVDINVSDMSRGCIEGACDVSIAEGELGVADSVHIFGLSSVKHSSKAVT